MIHLGATLLEPGRTRFRLWAPDFEQVSVEIDDAGAFPMTLDADGVFTAELPFGAGAHYRYRISPEMAVPDPASRFQVRGVHDHSIVTDPAYAWQYPDWPGRSWNETVLYELHPGAFGGFTGIAAQLPRLAKLGITAIELMPVAAFPGVRNWGYDGVLHYAPQASYGTPDELKSMIDTAHGLGLMVFLDVVYNHFGPDGNYIGAYASKFFNHDIKTPWGDAIDFREPHVRRFYIENALYWLQDFRFDGLRFDAVHAIFDKTLLTELAAEVRARIPQRKIHLVLENEANDVTLLNAVPADQKFDAQWTDDWHHSMHVLLTGELEGYYEDFDHPAQRLARCLAEGFSYQGENSRHANKPRGMRSSHLPPTCFVIFLQNHDQIGNRAFGERLTSLVDPRKLRAAIFLQLMTPQIPLLFMGEEWGCKTPFLFFVDHHDELADAVREGRRTEFAHFSAFGDPAKRASIPDPNAPATFVKSIPVQADPLSEAEKETLTFYEAILKCRAEHIVPRIAGAVSLGAEALNDSAVRAAWRMGDGAILTVAANFGTAPVSLTVTGAILAASNPQTSYDGATLPSYSSFAWLAQP
jgi:maltooligosyltrehalose trehalohydrolase